jgi:hypothetical protein
VDYEMTIVLRRKDPKLLASDFEAVSNLLEERRAKRTPSGQSALSAAERIIQRQADAA